MKKLIVVFFLLAACYQGGAQNRLSLKDALRMVIASYPELKMHEAEIRSQEATAKGAYSWMPPELGTGFWMTPYNPGKIKGEKGMPGMGQYMISAQQMIPNKKRQNAEAGYLQSLSRVSDEVHQQAINEIASKVKMNYYQLVVDQKKMSVLEENEQLIDFMIKSAEIRYKNGIDKLNAYYKAKASLGNIHSTQLVLQNDMAQMRIGLNTLLFRNSEEPFTIDTTFEIREYPAKSFDTSLLVYAKSDIRAINREIESTSLQQELERSKLKPEFGLRFDHMIGLSHLPAQFTLMGMVKIPWTRWSSRMGKANIESLQWKATSLSYKRSATINEAVGMAFSKKSEFDTKKKQLRVYESEIIPALTRYYQTVQIAYEQNTEELLVLYDAWERLNMARQEQLDILLQVLTLQTELERILEINNK